MQRQLAALHRNQDTPDVQLTWFEVFQADVAFNVIGQFLYSQMALHNQSILFGGCD